MTFTRDRDKTQTLPSELMPRRVECPRCGAGIGEPCVKGKNGIEMEHHHLNRGDRVHRAYNNRHHGTQVRRNLLSRWYALDFEELVHWVSCIPPQKRPKEVRVQLDALLASGEVIETQEGYAWADPWYRP